MTVPRRLRAAAARDDGSVTVEAALGIASLVVVVALAAAGAGAALTQIRVVDAAREAARVAAMSGVEEGTAAGRVAAPGADVSVVGYNDAARTAGLLRSRVVAVTGLD